MREVPDFRVVGSASEAGKRKARWEFEDKFSRNTESLPAKEQEELRKLEYPKSPKEKALIEFANRETDRLMEELGLEPFDVPEENQHIVPPEVLNREKVSNLAVTKYRYQTILYNAAKYRDNPVSFGASAFHETLHLKGHQTLEVTDLPREEGGDSEVEIGISRAGVDVSSDESLGHPRRGHTHFGGLHEAIVSET